MEGKDKTRAMFPRVREGGGMSLREVVTSVRLEAKGRRARKQNGEERAVIRCHWQQNPGERLNTGTLHADE